MADLNEKQLQLDLAVAACEPWPDNYVYIGYMAGCTGPEGQPSRELQSILVRGDGAVEVAPVYSINDRVVSGMEYERFILRSRTDFGRLALHREYGETMSVSHTPGLARKFKVPLDRWHGAERERRNRHVDQLPTSQRYVDAPMWRVLSNDWHRRAGEYNRAKFLAATKELQRQWTTLSLVLH